MSTAQTPILVDYKLPVDEMTDKQIKKVIGVVSRHLGINAENQLGMPYTSSSAFAGLWNTNCEWDVGGGRMIQGFTLAKDNRVIMITHTEDETEYWFSIGKLRRTCCENDDGDDMCKRCNCWKLSRAYCS